MGHNGSWPWQRCHGDDAIVWLPSKLFLFVVWLNLVRIFVFASLHFPLAGLVKFASPNFRLHKFRFHDFVEVHSSTSNFREFQEIPSVQSHRRYRLPIRGSLRRNRREISASSNETERNQTKSNACPESLCWVSFLWMLLIIINLSINLINLIIFIYCLGDFFGLIISLSALDADSDTQNRLTLSRLTYRRLTYRRLTFSRLAFDWISVEPSWIGRIGRSKRANSATVLSSVLNSWIEHLAFDSFRHAKCPHWMQSFRKKFSPRTFKFCTFRLAIMTSTAIWWRALGTSHESSRRMQEIRNVFDQKHWNRT